MALGGGRRRRSHLLTLPLLILSIMFLVDTARSRKPINKEFGVPFNELYYDIFSVESPAMISNDALQITPDSWGNFRLANRSGRVLFNHRFKLWDRAKVASFNTSFVINIFRVNDSLPGEGLAFIIAPNLEVPLQSSGQYMGLTNLTTDGNATNHLIAVEFDTFKQDFDPDANHIGLDINSVRSNQTKSLSNFDLHLAPKGTTFFHVWVQYNGMKKHLDVYMVDENTSTPTKPMPSEPVMSADLDISQVVKDESYFGFAASTGTYVELNCVLAWNLTVENLSKDSKLGIILALGIGLPAALVILGVGWWSVAMHRRRVATNDPNILGALKSLPGTPREFSFKELKKATNNFDDEQRLGEGGFGVVYRGTLPPKENNLEIAVKKFNRDKIKSKDDFLAELTIINRLRHKHLVQLLGWCHKNGMLLLVYHYMPKGSLDAHIFCPPEKATLGWNLRYKILNDVSLALHYLHNEYDQKVLHRDLKASNIMLDDEFNARLGDFGLARAIDNGKTSYAELDGVPGTFGYIAPECLHTGKASRESDVYGFGAVILEVICGQRPWTKIGDFQLLVDWVWYLHRDGRLLEAVDGRLGGDYVAEEAQRLLFLGLACSHPIASERPKTQAIVQILSGSVPPPQVSPFKPPFVWPSMGPLNIDGDTTDTTPITSSAFGSGWTQRESFAGYSDSSFA
ncbi:probable L-type lectin-domain containing receptor kinase S.5 isoform X2 [Punica granatum]|uniref:non-specific serine/threonine protein kinase n=1 Tax=Punica granatum TaxID=22663 RepID=A0A218W838_PUNGR|nr:probable L-type lectin-domain containing receptor kinase S.5 isoform X2 [Punica granatum]OWM68361.1 hypothetical protein CDL15_Pgr004843 [Punica granatum]